MLCSKLARIRSMNATCAIRSDLIILNNGRSVLNP
jgi:hypothetical protein